MKKWHMLASLILCLPLATWGAVIEILDPIDDTSIPEGYQQPYGEMFGTGPRIICHCVNWNGVYFTEEYYECHEDEWEWYSLDEHYFYNDGNARWKVIAVDDPYSAVDINEGDVEPVEE